MTKKPKASVPAGNGCPPIKHTAPSPIEIHSIRGAPRRRAANARAQCRDEQQDAPKRDRQRPRGIGWRLAKAFLHAAP